MKETTVEVRITVTEREDEPGALRVQVEGPDNIVLALGVIELGKGKLLAPRRKEPPLVTPVPGIHLNDLRLHKG